MRALAPLTVVLASILGLLTLTAAAQAAGAQGSFVVRNPYGAPIHYQVKWGDGEWQSHTVAGGCSRWHSYPLDENGRVPTPSIRFDHVAGDNDVTYKSYKVDVYATHCPENGKKHVFRYSRCGCFLDLYAE